MPQAPAATRSPSAGQQAKASATVFAPATCPATSAGAQPASAAMSTLPRFECRSSRPCASLVIFATPPATVTRGTGRCRRYFSIPPAKSPISSSATSGNPCSAAAAASETDPVLPATCPSPIARATSIPRWIVSIQAAHEYGTTIPVVPRIESPPTIPSRPFSVRSASASPPGTPTSTTTSVPACTSSSAAPIIARGTGLIAGSPGGSASPGRVTMPTPGPARNTTPDPGTPHPTRTRTSAPCVTSGSSPASFTTPATAMPASNPVSASANATRPPRGSPISTGSGNAPPTSAAKAAFAAAAAHAPVVQPRRNAVPTPHAIRRLMTASKAWLVAAPRSGAGKTTVTIGLVAALRARGIPVRTAKSGPDYIDPAFHAAASGRPGTNLDSWAMPPALLDHLAIGPGLEPSDVLIVESAMGLFDGVPGPPGRTGAAADLAERFALPVLLVLDVSGQSQTAAAVAHGMATFRPGVRVGGVVLNRVGSPRHRAGIEAALAAIGLPVLGAIPRDPGLALPERHLGLVQAREHPDLRAYLDALAAMAERCLDIDAILAAGTPVQPHSGSTASALPPPGQHMFLPPPGQYMFLPPPGQHMLLPPPGQRMFLPPPGQRMFLPPPGQRIALAHDAAFSFVYPHLVAGWHAQGAEILPFSPLEDEPPPPQADTCWLPGGYPELHAPRLAAATTFLQGLRAFAATRPVHGECGGYMALGATLEDADGVTHPMAGLLGHASSFARRRMTLGYRTATLLQPGALGPPGTTIRGHEFHYAQLTQPGPDTPLATITDGQGQPLPPAGTRRAHVTGTFFHAIARQS